MSKKRSIVQINIYIYIYIYGTALTKVSIFPFTIQSGFHVVVSGFILSKMLIAEMKLEHCLLALLQLHLLDLTLGFNWLDKDNCKTRRETFKFWNFVFYIRSLTIYIFYHWLSLPYGMFSSNLSCCIHKNITRYVNFNVYFTSKKKVLRNDLCFVN